MQLWLLQGMSVFLESCLLITLKPLKSKCNDELKFVLVQHLSPGVLCYLLEIIYLHAVQVCSLRIHGYTECGKINGGNLPPFWLIQGELGIRWVELAL